jgi:hypothetical protein
VVELLLQRAHLGQQLVGVVGGHQFGDLVEPGQHGDRVGHALLDVAQDVLVLVQVRFLQQDADRVAGREQRVPVGGLLQAGHDLQNGGLTGAVGADHADFRTRKEGQGDVVENDLVAVCLSGFAQGVDELRHADAVHTFLVGSADLEVGRVVWTNPTVRP